MSLRIDLYQQWKAIADSPENDPLTRRVYAHACASLYATESLSKVKEGLQVDLKMAQLGDRNDEVGVLTDVLHNLDVALDLDKKNPKHGLH